MQKLFSNNTDNFNSILKGNIVSKKEDIFVHNKKRIDNNVLIALDFLCKYRTRLSNYYLGYDLIFITFLTKDNTMYHIIVVDEENKKEIVKLVNSYTLSIPEADKRILSFTDR